MGSSNKGVPGIEGTLVMVAGNPRVGVGSKMDWLWAGEVFEVVVELVFLGCYKDGSPEVTDTLATVVLRGGARFLGMVPSFR